MKILRRTQLPAALLAGRRAERGTATLVFITLLAIMMILVTAEARALVQLHREVKFLEQQQIKRLNSTSTSAPTAPTPEPK